MKTMTLQDARRMALAMGGTLEMSTVKGYTAPAPQPPPAPSPVPAPPVKRKPLADVAKALTAKIPHSYSLERDDGAIVVMRDGVERYRMQPLREGKQIAEIVITKDGAPCYVAVPDADGSMSITPIGSH